MTRMAHSTRSGPVSAGNGCSSSSRRLPLINMISCLLLLIVDRSGSVHAKTQDVWLSSHASNVVASAAAAAAAARDASVAADSKLEHDESKRFDGVLAVSSDEKRGLMGILKMDIFKYAPNNVPGPHNMIDASMLQARGGGGKKKKSKSSSKSKSKRKSKSKSKSKSRSKSKKKDKKSSKSRDKKKSDSSKSKKKDSRKSKDKDSKSKSKSKVNKDSLVVCASINNTNLHLSA